MTVFFYGRFMDAAALAERGVNAGPGRRARAKGWQLSFAPAPTLTTSFCGVVWGMLYELSAEDLERLYSVPLHGFRYERQAITVSIGGEALEAVAYVAPPRPDAAADPEAVDAVRAAARAVGLSAAYVDSIGRSAP